MGYVGEELVYAGRLETANGKIDTVNKHLLDVLKENGFHLVYTERETKFGKMEYYQILYPKEDYRHAKL